MIQCLRSYVPIKKANFFKYFSFSSLKFTSDLYKSIHVDPNSLPVDTKLFKTSLAESEKEWKNSQMKAVWLQINVTQVNLLQEAFEQKYEIHHATKTHIMLSKWLLENEINQLPGYASHYVGCGGAVINSKNELLLVNEKYGYNSGMWSFPGGRSDGNGEQLEKTAEREVWEEVGLKCKANDLLLFRESSLSLFNKQDIFFCFLMSPIEPNQVVKKCERELNDFKWVPLSQLDKFITTEPVSHYLVQRRIIDKVNELYKSGFDFSKDKVTNNGKYMNYPWPGVTQTIYEPKN